MEKYEVSDLKNFIENKFPVMREALRASLNRQLHLSKRFPKTAPRLNKLSKIRRDPNKVLSTLAKSGSSPGQLELCELLHDSVESMMIYRDLWKCASAEQEITLEMLEEFIAAIVNDNDGCSTS